MNKIIQLKNEGRTVIRKKVNRIYISTGEEKETVKEMER